MIARISGSVIECEQKAIIVDVQGVGYRVFVSSHVLAGASPEQSVSFHIYDHMSDSRRELFGFESKVEQQHFELLLAVPSVGPKMARSILDECPPALLQRAISSGDVAMLTKISGVGKRTAERILIELKGKLDTLPEVAAAPARPVYTEIAEALMSIGFSGTQARDVVSKLPEGIESVEEGVKAALQTTTRA